jgi:hypothetical protein
MLAQVNALIESFAARFILVLSTLQDQVSALPVTLVNALPTVHPVVPLPSRIAAVPPAPVLTHRDHSPTACASETLPLLAPRVEPSQEPLRSCDMTHVRPDSLATLVPVVPCVTVTTPQPSMHTVAQNPSTQAIAPLEHDRPARSNEVVKRGNSKRAKVAPTTTTLPTTLTETTIHEVSLTNAIVVLPPKPVRSCNAKTKPTPTPSRHTGIAKPPKKSASASTKAQRTQQSVQAKSLVPPSKSKTVKSSAARLPMYVPAAALVKIAPHPPQQQPPRINHQVSKLTKTPPRQPQEFVASTFGMFSQESEDDPDIVVRPTPHLPAVQLLPNRRRKRSASPDYFLSEHC